MAHAKLILVEEVNKLPEEVSVAARLNLRLDVVKKR